LPPGQGVEQGSGTILEIGSQILPADQTKLQAYRDELDGLARTAAENLWEMGRILSEAQEVLAHYGNGCFQQWVESIGLSKRTAYRLLNVHQSFDCANLAQTTFGVSALYLLSEPSTPKPARAEAARRAQNGEAITYTKAQEIVEAYTPRPAPEPPPEPEPAPDPYLDFEHQSLLPHLHDAGNPSAPQMLSSERPPASEPSPEQAEHARTNLRTAIVEQLRTARKVQTDELDECANEMLELMGHRSHSIAIAARFGAALAIGPQTLADLTDISIVTSGLRPNELDRTEYLRWRRRTLRLLDAITYCGMPIYEHTLENGQIVYGLLNPELEKENNG